MRPELNYQRNPTNNTNKWRPNNMLLNNQWITEEIKQEIKNTEKQMKTKPQQSKIYGMQEKYF